jgi:hypothetical protein
MALVLALAGFATKLYLDHVRRKDSAAADSTAGADLDASTAEPSAAAGTVARAVGGSTDSTDDAARLHERGFAETVPGVAGAGMFVSSSQQGPEPGTPGLPDFARGA